MKKNQKIINNFKKTIYTNTNPFGLINQKVKKMQGIVELASINDISNIVKSKACGLSFIYYVKAEDVEVSDTKYKMIVKMDLDCNPESVFYTKTLDLENIEKQCVISKTYNNRWDKECKCNEEVKKNTYVKSELEKKIQTICTKLFQ